MDEHAARRRAQQAFALGIDALRGLGLDYTDALGLFADVLVSKQELDDALARTDRTPALHPDTARLRDALREPWLVTVRG